jgi:hypothetical protein
MFDPHFEALPKKRLGPCWLEVAFPSTGARKTGGGEFH